MPNGNEVKKQYSNSNNLEARIQLHKLYSTNKTGWSTWIFNQIDFQKNYQVLELGSGTGSFWLANKTKLPYMNIIITDSSEGMLNTVRKKLESLNCNVTFNLVDSQEIPYMDNSFDIIIANHMIYHIPDINKAISEIYRVLKPNGKLYTTTLGKDNMTELASLLHNFDNSIVFPSNKLIERFGLDSGSISLRKFFKNVDCKRYKDSLWILKSIPLLNYVLSLEGIGNVLDIIRDERVNDFRDYLDVLINKDGKINIKKDSGILIAKN
ncbi:hypothetical protein AN1V17_51400 [Vallitalea sediminicola]